MGWPKLLVLVRHAESAGNVLTVDERATFECSTHAYPLTPLGRDQARISGEYVRETFGEFDVRYTSYYARAVETGQLLFPELKPAYMDPRLAEGQRGVFHQLTRKQLEELLPWELERRNREGKYHFRPLGGENWPDIELRIHSFLGTLTRDCHGKKVCIVVHGHWLILFERLIHHFGVEEAERRYEGHVVKNASVTVYEGSGKKRTRLSRVGEAHTPWEGKILGPDGTPA